MLKKLISSIIALTVTLSSVSAISSQVETASADTSTQNYAEALQKSLYFYECQQAGPLPEWNEVEWRGDSTLDDYITGGWYDAGDHVKFNLPMSYSASMLAWGLYQYKDGIESGGLLDTYVNNLTFVLDYIAACDMGDDVVYQVGNGTDDHTWWGPVELVEYGMESQNIQDGRSYYEEGRNASAVTAEMAASLAAGYCALSGLYDADTLDSYLEHAENMFKMADEDRSDDGYQSSNAQGFYSSSQFYDDLFFAANWLYMATNDKSYLDKATSYIPSLGTELGTNELKYSWCQCWDDVQQGGMLLYAQNTNDTTYINQVKKHLDYWVNNVSTLDGGLKWLTTWGCLRYATTAAFIASVACDTILDGTDTSKYVDFYETQINYCLGDNPDNQSYVVGYGENSPHNVHHRTAHSSWNNSMDEPENNRHTLYGALVGGPTQDGSYEDSRGNYINNEVACDYNAGFTALLGKMISKYGGEKLDNFPEAEERTQEFFVEAAVKQSSASGVSLSLKFTNESAWPARIEDNMSYRYFMDLSEVIEAGYSPSDVTVRIDRDQAQMYSYDTAEVSPITQYKDNIYYIEVTYPDGRVAMPISEGNYQCELMIALVFPNYQSGWDSSNDFSFKDLASLDSTESVVSDNIPIYQNGVLIYGNEPDSDTVPTLMTENANPVIGSSSSDNNSTEKETTTTTTTTLTTTTTTVTTTTADSETTEITETVQDTEELTTQTETNTETEITETMKKTPDKENYLYGDVNADTKVDVSDVVLLNKYIVNCAELSDYQIENANCFYDEKIDSVDSLSILKYLVLSISDLPCTQ